MTSSATCDVTVIGGGPAGSTTASYLAMAGYDVTVLEQAIFPRDHVGESLLPFCYRIFEEIGVLDEMSKRYVRKPGVRFVDVDGETSTTFCFGHKIFDETNLSFQVLRAEFDELLLDNAARHGATVHQGAKVEAVDFHGPEDVEVRAVDRDGRTITVGSRFVVDCSGRETFLANRLQTKTAHKELARTALSSHWRGARFEGGLQEGMINIVYTGGEKQGWIWVIPLGHDRLSIGVVMNTSYFRSQRVALKQQGVGDWQQALYDQELGEAAFTKHILQDAEQYFPIQYNGDYSYFCERKWGDDYALVGDASAFIDPIFSSGVYLAMNSARLASKAIDTRLREGLEAGAAAMESTYAQIVGAYGLVDKLIRLFYTPEAINFAQLGSAEGAFNDFEHYQNAISVYHYLIAGDFFEQAGRYEEFVEQLREPRLFRRYKKLVIDRPGFQADSSCEQPRERIFGPSLAEWDAVRAERGI
jgi:flavin-dependent dehydrogenase